MSAHTLHVNGGHDMCKFGHEFCQLRMRLCSQGGWAWSALKNLTSWFLESGKLHYSLLFFNPSLCSVLLQKRSSSWNLNLSIFGTKFSSYLVFYRHICCLVPVGQQTKEGGICQLLCYLWCWQGFWENEGLPDLIFVLHLLHKFYSGLQCVPVTSHHWRESFRINH